MKEPVVLSSIFTCILVLADRASLSGPYRGAFEGA